MCQIIYTGAAGVGESRNMQGAGLLAVVLQIDKCARVCMPVNDTGIHQLMLPEIPFIVLQGVPCFSQIEGPGKQFWFPLLPGFSRSSIAHDSRHVLPWHSIRLCMTPPGFSSDYRRHSGQTSASSVSHALALRMLQSCTARCHAKGCIYFSCGCSFPGLCATMRAP